MSKAKDPANMSANANKNLNPATAVAAGAAGAGATAEGGPQEQQIRVNGFQQVIDMLRVADPAFRESLLKRLALKDRELANSLRRDLAAENN